MQSAVSHSVITQLHKNIAAWHKGINGFYRFNFAELAGQLRKGVHLPVLMLESYSSQLSRNSIQTTNWNDRDISFLLLDTTIKADNYDKQEEVLDRLEGVALDIVSLLEKFRKEKGHYLYGLFDTATVKIEKVGPLYDNLYGWNVIYTLKSQEPLCLNAENWDFTAA